MVYVKRRTFLENRGTMNQEIRWVTGRDMSSMTAIESASFSKPWKRSDFDKCLGDPTNNRIGKVFEVDGEVVGFIIYELQFDRFYIINMAVMPSHRKRGIAREMIGHVTDKLNNGYKRRRKVETYVSDHFLDAHIFFKRVGFRAIGVERDFFGKDSGDAYLFCYRSDSLGFDFDDSVFVGDYA